MISFVSFQVRILKKDDNPEKDNNTGEAKAAFIEGDKAGRQGSKGNEGSDHAGDTPAGATKAAVTKEDRAGRQGCTCSEHSNHPKRQNMRQGRRQGSRGREGSD